MCNDTFSKILAFIGALVLGALTALLHLTGVFMLVRTMAFIGLVLALGVAVYVLVLLAGEGRERCLCRYGSSLWYAAVLSAVAAVLLLVVADAFGPLATVLVGVWATLAFFTLILLCMLVSCRLAQRCGCSPCAGNGEGRCTTCRYN